MSLAGIDIAKRCLLRSAPTSRDFLLNARFTIDQLRMLSEGVAAKHDMALGPVLHGSNVFGGSLNLDGLTLSGLNLGVVNLSVHADWKNAGHEEKQRHARNRNRDITTSIHNILRLIGSY